VALREFGSCGSSGQSRPCHSNNEALRYQRDRKKLNKFACEYTDDEEPRGHQDAVKVSEKGTGVVMTDENRLKRDSGW
jgi:hypothetical protein